MHSSCVLGWYPSIKLHYIRLHRGNVHIMMFAILVVSLAKGEKHGDIALEVGLRHQGLSCDQDVRAPRLVRHASGEHLRGDQAALEQISAAQTRPEGLGRGDGEG